ncbi:MAG: hypothetical protein CMO12_03035 [Thaumarchaeota archaeon]|jgi:MFS family permease|nr:hypothetical protein [Nitrososphaerota archaeon]|tara:strand:- start:3992 stop:5158 length:1167 start_codon:yes stop_codon:yes gene_type:complete
MTLPLYVLTFWMETVLSMFRFLLPFYLLQLAASTFEVGLVIGAFGLTVAISAIPLGYLSDRIGRMHMVTLGFVFIAISAFVVASRTNIYELLPAYIFMGFAMACASPSLDASIADNIQMSRVGAAMGRLASSIQMGIALGPAMAGFIAASMGIVSTLYVAALFSLVLFVMLPFASRILRNSGSKEKHVKRNHVLPVNKGTVVGWGGFFASFIIWGGIAAFVPIYAAAGGLEISIIGMIFSIQAAVAFVARIPLGELVDRLRQERRLIIIGVVIASLTVSLMGYLSGAVMILVAMIVISLARSTINVSSLAVVARSASQDDRGAAMGAGSSSRNMGNAIGPILMGAILGFEGYVVAFSLLGLSALAILSAVIVGISLVVGRHHNVISFL